MTALELSREHPAGASAEKHGDVWMWRANPLPRRRIAHGPQVDLVRQLVTVERELLESAELCSAELYVEIGSSTASRRAELLRLRRIIHNGRTAASVPDALPAHTARWCRLAERRDTLRAALRAGHRDAIEAERDAVLGMLADEDFQRALALVSPEVYQAALAYRRACAGSATAETARPHKSERGLLQYLTRAMMRTSPLSRFTAVGLAVNDANGLPLGQFDFPGASALLFFDLAMIRYVAGGIGAGVADPWLMRAPTVRVDTTVEFLRPVGTQVRRLSTPLTQPLRALLELTAMGPRRSSMLAAALAGRLRITREHAAGLVESAAQGGMLCTVGGPDSALPALPTNVTVLLEDSELAAQLGTLANVPAADRRKRLGRLDEMTTRLSRAAHRPAKLTVNEDYIGAPNSISSYGYEEALQDLNNTVELLSMFDRMHVVRALASTAFIERFGPGASVPLTEHAEALVATVYRREQSLDANTATELGPRDGSLRRLLELRRQASAVVGTGIDNAVAAGAVEACWPSADLARLASALPRRFRAEPLSYGVLTQLAGDDLLFNDAYAGNGMLYGRFLAADSAAGGGSAARLADQLQRWYGADGARVVEDRGLHGMSINHHQPVLPEGLDAEDWYSLRLVHDQTSDTLHLADADGRRVRVLTLGVAMPELHPFPLRLANWLVAGGRLVRDFADGWHQDTGAVAVPRLRAGRVIFSRRRWYSEDFEAIASRPDIDDAQRLLDLTRWRAQHDVNEQVLLKVPLRTGSGRRPGAKPQYIDLASGMATRALPRMLARRESGYLEEALPAVDASEHAVEWVVEVLRRPGQRFGGGT